MSLLHPELLPASLNVDLADSMASRLVQSRSDGTTNNYYTTFKRWENFITAEGGRAIPAEPIHVALYLTNLIDEGKSPSVIQGARGRRFLIHKNKPMSYTRTRETVVARLKEVGEGSNIGLHSLRASGATAAARAKVNDRVWKRHGRWKGERAKDGYVEDSLEDRLLVSQALQL